jgi:UDP-N-acetylglucosamine 2-epimerase (non-hydrolysing)
MTEANEPMMTPPHPYLIDCIVGARPNFVKIAPIMRALKARKEFTPRLIHTGQHYDVAMNAVFFKELGIPDPDINLEIGSGTGTEQTARIMLALEPVLLARRPSLLLVVGDVNSTVASALVASKLRIPVVHVEAGLRSNDHSMPEEINRLVTDRLSDMLFVTERAGIDNLAREGVAPERVCFVGNVMIDTLYSCLDRAIPARETLIGLAGEEEGEAALTRGFALVTLHRPSNVDDPAKLEQILTALANIARDIPLVFPMHPRTRTMIANARLEPLLDAASIYTSPPLSYLQTLGLMRDARLVITDSGGMQEETTGLGVPCLTFRDNTERPATVEDGTNVLVGTSPIALLAAVADALANGGKKGRIPPLWDGKASVRIAERIAQFLDNGR